MPRYSPTAVAALLKWVNLFSLDSPVESVADLTDGYVLSKMLEDISPKYAVHDLAENQSPSKWLTKKNSLEAVYRSLSRYIREECPDLGHLALDTPVDFNAIAEHNDTQETIKLLTIFLMAAVQGHRNADYVTAITTRLDKLAQGEIRDIIQKMSIIEEIATPSDPHPSSEYLPTDHDLALEEEIASLRTDLDAQMKKNADMITRFERLQVSYNDLLEQNTEKDARIEALESSNSGDQSQYISSLQSRIQEQNDLIEKQENQAESDRVAKQSYLKELVSLRPIRDRLLEAEDNLKELKQQNLELSKKANTVDHYQRKLAHQVTVESENLRLRDKVEVLEANLKDFDKVFEENEKINNTLQEYQKKFEMYETEIVEHSNHKHLLEEEVRLQNARVQSLTARQQHDEKFILELQEQMRINSTGPLSPDSPTAKTSGLNLEQELEQSAEQTPNYALEISRLKSENNTLKDDDRRTNNANLRIDLAESERIRKRLEENLRDLTERHAIAQEQLSAVISSSSGEKNDALAHTRKLYLEANQELATIKTKLAEVEAQLTSRDREILAAKADLNAVDQDELDAIEDLKATNGIITTSIENDLLVLRKQHQDLTTDFEQQKSQLLEALLSKDRLMQDLASLKERTGTTEEELIERAKARSTKEAELEERIIKQDTLIEELQHKLKTAEEAAPDAQKAANESMIKNLTRENALIATAWYGLTSRLQSNHVVLERRQDAQKTWLNKQRQMVQATGRR